MEHRPIPWSKLVAICTLCGLVYAGGTWAWNIFTGVAEKHAHADSAYVWSKAAHDSIPRFSHRFERMKENEKRDSADIYSLKHKRQ